jgi:RNA polymerase sigma-70 factor (ECF subfamily)
VDPPGKEDVTTLLLEWSNGRQEALNHLMPLVHDELRRLAGRHLRGERAGHTLQCTALVNELYLRLIDQNRVQWRDREHFFAVASQLVRRILVDYARSRNTAKRGSGEVALALNEAIAICGREDMEVLALDDALESLTQMDPQQGRIVELRFFGGLSIRGTANVLGISTSTVTRDWNLARAWLKRELIRGAAHGL